MLTGNIATSWCNTVFFPKPLLEKSMYMSLYKHNANLCLSQPDLAMFVNVELLMTKEEKIILWHRLEYFHLNVSFCLYWWAILFQYNHTSSGEKTDWSAGGTAFKCKVSGVGVRPYHAANNRLLKQIQLDTHTFRWWAKQQGHKLETH